jgi:hypothetical protein
MHGIVKISGPTLTIIRGEDALKWRRIGTQMNHTHNLHLNILMTSLTAPLWTVMTPMH